MGESTLSLSYNDLRKIVGKYLGYTRDSSKWTSEQKEDIDEVIKSGLRKFYYPPNYDWRFLKPVRTIDTVADQGDYDLPDDFAFMDGHYLTFQSDTTKGVYVVLRGEQDIRRFREINTASGRPNFAAVRPKEIDTSTSITEGQRFELMLYPDPDAVYTLEYRCEVIPYSLSNNRVYPYGGAVHAETIRQACLAAAEQTYNDGATQQEEMFRQMLQSSIRRDRQLSPRNIGEMTNPREYQDHPVLPRGYGDDLTVTVNGEIP